MLLSYLEVFPLPLHKIMLQALYQNSQCAIWTFLGCVLNDGWQIIKHNLINKLLGLEIIFSSWHLCRMPQQFFWKEVSMQEYLISHIIMHRPSLQQSWIWQEGWSFHQRAPPSTCQSIAKQLYMPSKINECTILTNRTYWLYKGNKGSGDIKITEKKIMW